MGWDNIHIPGVQDILSCKITSSPVSTKALIAQKMLSYAPTVVMISDMASISRPRGGERLGMEVWKKTGCNQGVNEEK